MANAFFLATTSVFALKLFSFFTLKPKEIILANHFKRVSGKPKQSEIKDISFFIDSAKFNSRRSYMLRSPVVALIYFFFF